MRTNRVDRGAADDEYEDDKADDGAAEPYPSNALPCPGRMPEAGALCIHVQDVEPIPALCRKLMSIGYDATQPIEFHQGRNIAAKFDSLAEGSRYKPKKRRAEANTSPPVSSVE